MGIVPLRFTMVFGAVHTRLGSLIFNDLKTFHNSAPMALNQKSARNEVEGRPDLIVKKLVSVIIPAYNEEQTIGQVLEALRVLPIEKQIIVVNDGSTDGTYKALEQLRKSHQIIVVHCKENRGKGFAIRSGLPHVQGEVVVIQDADMELSPTDLSELLKPLEQEDIQVVYGSRFLNGRRNASLRNFIANRVLATYTNLLYGCRITDESTGYKAFSAELITRLNLTCEGFEFCPEVTAKILRAGYRIHEVPISYFPRTKKEGKKLRFWSDGFLAAWTLLKYRFISKTELFKNTA